MKLRETTSLAPDSAFGDTTKSATSASLAIDISTTQIIEQPKFEHLKGVESLQEHQETSKVTAATWRADVRASLFSVNDSILSYNNLFSSIYDPLYALAGKIDTDQKARSDLVAGLTELKNEITRQKTKVSEAGGKLKTFWQAMANRESELSGDAAQIKSKYEGDKGMIEDLEKAIDAESAAMNSDLTMIAGGATGVVVGVLTISFGVFMWIESSGGSTYVIVAGIGILSAGAVAVGIGADNFNKAAKEKANKVKELAAINQEIAVAKHLQSDVGSLLGHIHIVVQAIDKLSIAWTQLENDYGELIAALNSTDPGKLSFIVMSHLDAAKKQWNAIAEDAATIKRNFLTPPDMDVEGPKSVKRGFTSFPLDTTKQMRGITYAIKTPMTTTAIVPAAVDRNLRLKTWLDETANGLLTFEQSLLHVGDATSVPASVSTANAKLADFGKVAVNPTNVFLASIEALGRHARILQQTSDLPDDAIVAAAMKVFQDLASQLKVSTECGKTAASGFNEMASAQMETVSAINGWLQNLKNEKDADLKSIAEFEKLRDEAEAEKKRSKNDFWWCFLGPIACAVVAIEQSQKVSAANAKIKVFNKDLAQTSNSLTHVVAAWTMADKLGSTITTLGKNIDGILKALQVLAVSVDGITASSSSFTPFIVRAHLQADAKEISDIGSPRLEATARLMRSSLNIGSSAARRLLRSDDAGQMSIAQCMQQVTSFTMNIQSTAKLISSQPRLIFVENLLKQNQELLVGHSHDWLMNFSAQVMSVLSRIHGLGVFIEFIAPAIRSHIEHDDIQSAVQGLESIDADLSRFSQYVFEIKLASTQFEMTTKDDQRRFITVHNSLRDQLVGKHGQLQALEDAAVALSAELTIALEHVVNAATALLIRDLKWGLVLALSIGLGQIELAGIKGAVLMNAFKDKVNIAVKNVSEAGSDNAKEEIKIVDDSQTDLMSIIKKRGQTLTDLSKLSADIAVLQALLQSVDAFRDNATRLRGILGTIADYFGSEMIASFYNIKVILNSGNKEEALKRVDKAIDDWKSITSASSLLQQTFYASF